MSSPYPEWTYYPANRRPDQWVRSMLEVVAGTRAEINTAVVRASLTSDAVLGHLRPGLVALGYEVEASKLRAGRVRRPVLFGSQGTERVAYEVDAVHDELGVVVEIEAGRGAQSNAVYRDLVRASLIVEARFFALGVMGRYRFQSGGRAVEVRSYDNARDQLDAIYASGRLRLPFEGVFLFGY
jgi:hypothetical protein